MHDNQVFKDGDEVYVWIYDPVPFKTFFIGLLLGKKLSQLFLTLFINWLFLNSGQWNWQRHMVLVDSVRLITRNRVAAFDLTCLYVVFPYIGYHLVIFLAFQLLITKWNLEFDCIAGEFFV